MKKSITCINCPLGCNLVIIYNKSDITAISGNSCNRGRNYAKKEIFAPERIITSTIKITGAKIPLLPVKTDRPIPKEKMFEIIKEISNLQVKAPICRGEIIKKNICSSKANLVATRTLVKARSVVENQNSAH